jgi:general stress protein YciG
MFLEDADFDDDSADVKGSGRADTSAYSQLGRYGGQVSKTGGEVENFNLFQFL